MAFAKSEVFLDIVITRPRKRLRPCSGSPTRWVRGSGGKTGDPRHSDTKVPGSWRSKDVRIPVTGAREHPPPQLRKVGAAETTEIGARLKPSPFLSVTISPERSLVKSCYYCSTLVVVPAGPTQQVLHAIGGVVPGVLGDRPAVRPRQPRE